MILYLNSFEGGPTTDFFNYFRFSSRIYLHKQQQKEEGRNSSSGIFIITPGWWSRKSWSLAAATLINWSTDQLSLRTIQHTKKKEKVRLNSGQIHPLISWFLRERWASGPTCWPQVCSVCSWVKWPPAGEPLAHTGKPEPVPVTQP